MNIIGKVKVIKGRYWYGLLAALFLTGCGALLLVDVYAIDKYYYLAFLLSLILGIFHILGLKHFLVLPRTKKYLLGFAVTILIMAISAIFLLLLYHYFKLNYSFITCICAFIIAYFIWTTYQFFINIPESNYKLWYYPVDEEMPDLDMMDLSEIEVVQFVLNKRYEDDKQTNFTSKAPLNMKLGQLYFIFINDYNERNDQQPIIFLDASNQPHGWLFYKETGLFKRKQYFDPDLSFRENIIIPNQTIFAVRKMENTIEEL